MKTRNILTISVFVAVICTGRAEIKDDFEINNNYEKLRKSVCSQFKNLQQQAFKESQQAEARSDEAPEEVERRMQQFYGLMGRSGRGRPNSKYFSGLMGKRSIPDYDMEGLERENRNPKFFGLMGKRVLNSNQNDEVEATDYVVQKILENLITTSCSDFQ